jgi:hypothetical protein
VTESKQIIDHCIVRGGSFFDTANAYTKGHSEKIIGDHVGRPPARRDGIVVATMALELGLGITPSSPLENSSRARRRAIRSGPFGGNGHDVAPAVSHDCGANPLDQALKVSSRAARRSRATAFVARVQPDPSARPGSR